MSTIELAAADIFSRGSLKLTFEILRQHNASLALSIRNILGSEPLAKTADAIDNKHADHFRVTLDSHQVRAVVEALATYCRQENGGEQTTGSHIMATVLLDDWLALARVMLMNLTSENPHSDS
jgi:hypothetical protein